MEFDDVGFNNGAPLRGFEDVTQDQPLEQPGTKFQQRKPKDQSPAPADAAPRRVSGASVDDDVRALAFDAFFASDFGQCPSSGFLAPRAA